MTWNESTNPMVDDRESGNQASEDENEEQAKRDPGVVGRNPRIVAEEGAPGMKIVPWKRTVAIFGGMSIAILVVVGIVLRNQRGRVAVALHRRRSGSRPDRAWVPELDHGSPRTEIQLSLYLCECVYFGFWLLLIFPLLFFLFSVWILDFFGFGFRLGLCVNCCELLCTC